MLSVTGKTDLVSKATVEKKFGDFLRSLSEEDFLVVYVYIYATKLPVQEVKVTILDSSWSIQVTAHTCFNQLDVREDVVDQVFGEKDEFPNLLWIARKAEGTFGMA